MTDTAKTTEDRIVLPIDDHSHSSVACSVAQLDNGTIISTVGEFGGGKFELIVEVPSWPVVRLHADNQIDADTLILLLLGARESAFGAPFDADAVSTRS